MAIVWIVLLVLFVVAEAATVGLASIWFAFGAAVAMLTALLGGQVWLQIVLFLVVSAVLLIFTRPLSKAYLDSKKQRTNADRNIGEIAIVTEQIDNIEGTGEAHIGGKRWTARSTTGEVIPKDARVIVDRIEGVKVLVTLVTEEAPQSESSPGAEE
ncbi:NfeD family protein [Oscillospiraceae bacterium OttesenSCG-928-G22]|nr:NfeD family protein [Oscillospiraceae bacterium OttesenSCG-928-G22]